MKMLCVTSNPKRALQWAAGTMVYVRPLSREGAVRQIEQYEELLEPAWDLDKRLRPAGRLADVCIVVTDAPVAYRLEIAPPLD
jgi:hypothetical protein